MLPIYSEQIGTRKTDQEARMELMVDQTLSRSPVGNKQFRAEDSWIEVTSQPSSSSLHSQSYNEVVTTDSNIRPGRRHLRNHIRARSAGSTSVAGSSQDEYEESESESDKVMSSSNEDINQKGEDGEDDDIATALGINSQTVFTPQPNAFSHPPQSSYSRSTTTSNSYFPPTAPTSLSDRLPSNRLVTQQTLAPRSLRRDRFSASRPQPDHDAALRASLTTLLSCAAAVGPPKEVKDRVTTPITRTSSQPTTLRLVPESELDASTRSPIPASKRRSRESSKERHTKKLRALKASSASEEVLSPTMMTWIISAGVVLVFSAISFSAGYAWGKEVGRLEGEMGLTSGACGRDALRSGAGLRKLRWSASTQSARV